MVGDRLVAFLQRHVASLTFAKIFKHPVGSLPVGVAVREPLLPLGDDNPALSLAFKTVVNIGPSIGPLDCRESK